MKMSSNMDNRSLDGHASRPQTPLSRTRSLSEGETPMSALHLPEQVINGLPEDTNNISTSDSTNSDNSGNAPVTGEMPTQSAALLTIHDVLSRVESTMPTQNADLQMARNVLPQAEPTMPTQSDSLQTIRDVLPQTESTMPTQNADLQTTRNVSPQAGPTRPIGSLGLEVIRDAVSQFNPNLPINAMSFVFSGNNRRPANMHDPRMFFGPQHRGFDNSRLHAEFIEYAPPRGFNIRPPRQPADFIAPAPPRGFNIRPPRQPAAGRHTHSVNVQPNRIMLNTPAISYHMVRSRETNQIVYRYTSPLNQPVVTVTQGFIDMSPSARASQHPFAPRAPIRRRNNGRRASSIGTDSSSDSD